MADILVAEDDPANRAMIQFVLEAQGGHRVRVVDSAVAAMQLLEIQEPDLLILDVVMPGMSGLDLCRQLRRGGSLPILMVSGLSGTLDRVIGLRSGADDYLPKPFDPTELLERINALLRRSRRTQETSGGSVVRAGDLRLGLVERHLWVGDRGPIPLTSTEARLLYVMLGRPDAPWSREELLKRLWDLSHSYSGPATAIESLVTRLRQKLERTARRPRYLVTVRGVGYKLCPTGGR